MRRGSTGDRGAEPDIAVVVPSHDRPLRLRWLLNALEEQTLPHERFEVIVAHDSSGPETEHVLRSHPLAHAGVLRHLTFPPGPGPASKRNAAWRNARAPLVAFTDDDCRPERDWLEQLLEAARRNPGAIVQGATRPDPTEMLVFAASPHARSQAVDPPGPFAQTCNIAYPRDVLEAVGGFDETLPAAAGEDTDLALRARAARADYVGAVDAVMYHAVEAMSLSRLLRFTWRWQHLAFVPKRHPEVRRLLPYGIFWKRRHVHVPLLVAGVALTLARRQPAYAALALPWARAALPRDVRRATALARLPARALVDVNEVAAMVRGSLRYRTLLL